MRNGSGGYSLLSNSWNPAVNGVSATAADWQALINDIAAAIQQSISADGQTPITGNLQMGGNKLTNLAAGSGTGQSLRYEQLFSQGTLTDIASAATLDIGAQLSNFLRVTGTTGITSFGTNYNGPRFLIFAGALILTHSATLVLPGAANITTAANDALIAVPISGGWQVVAYQRANGMPISTTGLALSGANTDITSLGGLTSPIPRANTLSKIESLPNPTLAANAMTLPASTHALDFRSATLSDGLPTTVTGTAAALVIPAGATLGTVNAVQNTIVEVIINNAGTLEKAVVNLAGGNDLSETGVISTTAISAGATSGNVFYSTTARTGVAYRVVRTITSTQATAGQWATAPSTIQGAGGNALASLVQRTWQNVTGSRALSTTYYNNAGRDITVHVVMTAAFNSNITPTVNGFSLAQSSIGDVSASSATWREFTVPAGQSYSVAGTPSIAQWSEFR